MPRGSQSFSLLNPEKHPMKTRLLLLVALWAGIAGAAQQPEGSKSDALVQGFLQPPVAAHPRVWWHWMNGNITKEGIKLDLEWMHRIGVAGVQNFDANLQTPQVVDQRLVFMTPEWKDAFRFAVATADQLGMEFAIATSPGWSQTGGPWVKPEQAMKKLVWSETRVRGGSRVRVPIAKPPATTGPFQDLPEQPANDRPHAEYYRDALVLAYPVPTAERGPLPMPRVSVSSGASSGEIDGERLRDGKLEGMMRLPYGQQREAWVRYDYDSPQIIHAVTAAIGGRRGFGAPPPADARLEASSDGINFRPVVDLPRIYTLQRTATFAPVQARSFRLVMTPGVARPPVRRGLPGAALNPNVQAAADPQFELSELQLHRAPRVHRFEEKAGFGTAPDYYAIATPASVDTAAIPSRQVIDLTRQLRPDGTLDWRAPSGEWVVLRLGYSLTGETNGPASPEATGLEVDKLNARHGKSYMDTYLEMYADVVGTELMGLRGFNALLTDSIESGSQNWTDNMVEQFRRLRGYDPRPWLPALTGRIVESPEASDRFLWDFRRTIAQLFVEGHYGPIAASAKERGLTLYGEALEDNRPQLGDDIEMRRLADIPMAAMWTFPADFPPDPTLVADAKGAASVAHVYGQNLAAAESMTASNAPWAFAPRDIKPVADLEFALGINRIVVHTSAHQPLTDDRKPGLSLAPTLGQYFNRNETWAEIAGPWVSYLSRTSHLLQQGRYVADVAFFIGEEAPITALYANGPVPDAPRMHGYDFVNADAILNVFQVEQGQLATPSGMRYSILYLGGSSRRGMTLPVLKRMGELVEQGAVIVGERPVSSPSLADDPSVFDALAARLWSGAGVQGGARHGQGRVIAGRTADQALAEIGVLPDVQLSNADEGIMFLHRALPEGEIYFLLNRHDRAVAVDATFRVRDKVAELWRADTGAMGPTSYRIQGDLTTVPLQLAAHDAVFVIFRTPTDTAARTLALPTEQVLAGLDGAWQLKFQPGRGAPDSIQLDRLSSWTEHADPGIKYFSGTATYARHIAVPRNWLQDERRILVDLGEVRDLAEVVVNGRALGVVWRPPFRVDVTEALQPGDNRIEIKVTNVWANRLVGDIQPGATKIAFITGNAYQPGAALRPSGLLGPVQVVAIDR